MQNVLKTFKTGGDLDFPILLWDKNIQTGVKTPVSVFAEGLQFFCSIFDSKNQKIATAQVSAIQGLDNGLMISVPATVTALWKPTIAKFDFRVNNTITGKTIYTRTIEFEIERGLS